MIAPQLVGTIPQWLTLGGVAALLGILLRYRLGIKKLGVEAERVAISAQEIANADAADVRDHLAEEIQNLRTELQRCEQDCDRRLGIHESRIRALDEELWAEKKQRVAEQISLINVIINSVDAPELKALLKTFESVRTHLGDRVAK